MAACLPHRPAKGAPLDGQPPPHGRSTLRPAHGSSPRAVGALCGGAVSGQVAAVHAQALAQGSFPPHPGLTHFEATS